MAQAGLNFENCFSISIVLEMWQHGINQYLPFLNHIMRILFEEILLVFRLCGILTLDTRLCSSQLV